jgi:hypothetical protein
VGVGGGGEDGEKAASKMLRHFRGLVDETASKAKFLSAFSRVGVGAARAAAGAERATEHVAERAAERERDCDGSQGATEARANGWPGQDAAGRETAGAWEWGSGGLHGDGEGAGQVDGSGDEADDVEAEAEVDGARDGTVPSLPEGNGGTSAAHASPSSADARRAELLEQLHGVLGRALTVEEARQLLDAAGGELQRAVNMFFDGFAPAAGPPLPTHDTCGNGGGAKQEQQAQQAQQLGASSATRKRAGATPQPSSAGKRRKGDQPLPGQRSILSFFGGTAASATAGAAAGRGTHASSQAGINPPGLQSHEFEGAGSRQLLDTAQQQTPTPTPSSTTAAPAHGADTFPAPTPAASTATSAPAAASPRPLNPPQQAQQAQQAVLVAKDAVTLPLQEYDAVEHAPWARGEPTPYLHIARTFSAMEATKKRLRISGGVHGSVRWELGRGAHGRAGRVCLSA